MHATASTAYYNSSYGTWWACEALAVAEGPPSTLALQQSCQWLGQPAAERPLD